MAAPNEVETSSLTNLLDLPSEIIDLILQDEILDTKDICRVSQTCTSLRNVCQSNELWRQKLQQRWPKLVQRYSRSVSHNWSQEYQKCHVIGVKVHQMVAALSPKYYHCDEISQDGFSGFVAIMDGSNAGETVLNELMEIIHHQDSNRNLTQKYYAAKVVRHLQHHHLTMKWKSHLGEPPGQQLLETGAILLSQWCQPTDNVIDNDIIDSLDKMAVEVIARCPYSIATNFQDGRCKAEVTWTSQQERFLLESLNYVLYNEYELKGNTTEYYDEKNSFIDRVLERKKGIPITLSIVYSAVARRLGIVCELLNFPTHLLLKWKEHPMASPSQQYTYIDAFNGGRFLSQEELPSAFNLPSTILNSLDIYKAISPLEVYQRMCRNLVNIGRQQGTIGDNLLCLRNALELSLLMSPEDTEIRLLHIRVNLHLLVDLEQVKESLQILSHLDQSQMSLAGYLMQAVDDQTRLYRENMEKKITPKLRDTDDNKVVEFSVGLVMQHKRYNYMCVIYGWDPRCTASQEWIEQMGVHNLPNKQYQPFYNVLVEDGSNRYAAQENLLHPDKESLCVISHPEVGKYFNEFNGRYYIPNTEKQTEYPNDVETTQRLVLTAYS